MFDPAEVHSTDEITGNDHWLIPVGDGQEVTVIPIRDTGLYEAVQWNQDGYGVRVKMFMTPDDVKSFIQDAKTP